MKRNAAKKVFTLIISAVVAISFATSAVAKSRESAQLVTAAYKEWVTTEGRTLTDRVRILLRPNMIVVNLTHELGTTKLIYSADGTVFLGELSEVAGTSARDKCRLRIRCRSGAKKRQQPTIASFEEQIAQQQEEAESEDPDANEDESSDDDDDDAGDDDEDSEKSPNNGKGHGKGKGPG